LAGKKRKAPGVPAGKKSKTKQKKVEDDEEIDSEGSDIEGRPDAGYESDEEDKETAEEKRLRLAKLYLEEIEKELEEREGGGEEVDKDAAVKERLADDVAAERGKLRKEVAAGYCAVGEEAIRLFQDKNHKLSITCTVISPDCRHLYTGSKDAGLVKWCLSSGAKLARVAGGRRGQEGASRGHCEAILALAVTSDSKILASGDTGKLVYIWDTETMVRIHTFKGHRDSVSGLAFRRGTHTLYSCSYDRSVKIWSVDEKAYVETLFGHQDKISGIDAGSRERAVTAGGRDGSVRVWKIVEESQLVFNGPATSVDCVKLLNEEHWVTSGEDGHLSTWGVMKKKPLCSISNCHGTDETNGDPRWVSALATLYNTDLVVTGSRDGYIRFWSVGEGFRTVREVQKVRVTGFVNSLDISSDGRYLVAGLGQEHRLGRWWRDKAARNKIAVIRLDKVAEKKEEDKDEEEVEEER